MNSDVRISTAAEISFRSAAAGNGLEHTALFVRQIRIEALAATDLPDATFGQHHADQKVGERLDTSPGDHQLRDPT